ncbi:hypothetical protein C8R46DRAFT_1167838 [Mycena filopes]|nr:hypothetical protein C8R46DRAFT_1167838 [Mycena filopes]
MAEFKEIQQVVLEEIMRLSGLADSMAHPKCALCDCALDADAPVVEVAKDGLEPSFEDDTPDRRIFKCAECGEFLQCRTCCMHRHLMTPLHFLKVWARDFWADKTLKALGLVYQLGHQGGACPTPPPAIRQMVVIDTTGIHQIRYKRCGCARSDAMNPVRELVRNAWYPSSATDPDTCATFKVLDTFRLLNVIGNVNAHDFMTALERLTSPVASTGMEKVPDRYKNFLRMARQFPFLDRALASGRGNDPKGLAATKQGELLPACWGCPFDGRNLPANWRDVEPKSGYLYRLVLAMDANFKLKNRIRINEREDPSLGPGWGAFVEPTRYREHLKHYVAEHDVSTCIAFAALTQKETRNTAGLRVSGVGACVCARHESVRPNGIGDLQKGERYANMDYILLSSLAGFNLTELTVSYDIACQWRKNLLERIKKLPADMQIPLENFLFQCGLPVWHASSHEASCANLNSLSFMQGVGKSDGEGIERLWAELNAFAFHTKSMGLGHRADTLEDKIYFHNSTKNLGLPNILRRKLVVAIAECERQVAAWKEVNKSVPSDVRAIWQDRINTFLADRTKPNPYILTAKNAATEPEIRALLKKAEEDAVANGEAPLHGTSATAFLTAGLQLEDSQRRIKAELAGTTLLTADRESKIQEYCLALLAKLRPFRALQQVYTPAAITAVERLEQARNPDAAPVRAENIQLFLPSALTAVERVTGCKEGLAGMEAKLREAQCTDALTKIRRGLHAKRHVTYWRGSNVGGQHSATRANTLGAQLGDRIDAMASKYRAARAALLTLNGPNYAPHLKPLKTADLTLDGDVKDDESNAKKQLSLISAGKGGRVPRHVAGTSKTVMSWIWAAEGALDDAEGDLHESLRVEWARAKARKTRWEEEVNLLREEMRRVLRYLEWETNTWEERANVSNEAVPVETRAGMRAYAKKQADVHRRLGAFYWRELNMSLGDAAAASTLEDGEALNELFGAGEADSTVAT